MNSECILLGGYLPVLNIRSIWSILFLDLVTYTKEGSPELLEILDLAELHYKGHSIRTNERYLIPNLRATPYPPHPIMIVMGGVHVMFD